MSSSGKPVQQDAMATDISPAPPTVTYVSCYSGTALPVPTEMNTYVCFCLSVVYNVLSLVVVLHYG